MSDGPSVIFAIIAGLGTIVALFALVIGFGPIFDWFTVYIAANGPNPYANTWFMLAKFFYFLILACGVGSLIYIWRVVIQKVQYRRDGY